MALVDQTQEMKDAYGENFSQQDLTDPQENQVPQQLQTAEYQEGDLAFAREHHIMPAQSVSRTVPKSTVQKAKKVTR